LRGTKRNYVVWVLAGKRRKQEESFNSNESNWWWWSESPTRVRGGVVSTGFRRLWQRWRWWIRSRSRFLW